LQPPFRTYFKAKKQLWADYSHVINVASSFYATAAHKVIIFIFQLKEKLAEVEQHSSEKII